jgi:hypothetical protein
MELVICFQMRRSVRQPRPSLCHYLEFGLDLVGPGTGAIGPAREMEKTW